MSATDDSLRSAYRETLLERLFLGELMRHVWLSGTRGLEILEPQVDDSGYDLVLEAKSIVRHVQLKATFRGSTVNRFNLNSGLSDKQSGCVIVLLFERDSLKLGPFLWLGGGPGQRLPDLSGYRIARHTKGNAQGVKLERPRIRVVPRSAFTEVDSVKKIVELLFGIFA